MPRLWKSKWTFPHVQTVSHNWPVSGPRPEAFPWHIVQCKAGAGVVRGWVSFDHCLPTVKQNPTKQALVSFSNIFFPTYVYKQKYNQAYLFYKIGLVETNQLCTVILESSITHKSVISCLSLTNLPSAVVGDGGGTLGGQRQADLCEFLYLIKDVFLKHTTACLNRLDFFLLFRVGNLYIFF